MKKWGNEEPSFGIIFYRILEEDDNVGYLIDIVEVIDYDRTSENT